MRNEGILYIMKRKNPQLIYLILFFINFSIEKVYMKTVVKCLKIKNKPFINLDFIRVYKGNLKEFVFL